jgi:hypothetical protein
MCLFSSVRIWAAYYLLIVVVYTSPLLLVIIHLIFTHQIPCSIHNLVVFLLLGRVVLACVRVRCFHLQISRIGSSFIYVQIYLYLGFAAARWSYLWRRLDIKEMVVWRGALHNLILS